MSVFDHCGRVAIRLEPSSPRLSADHSLPPKSPPPLQLLALLLATYLDEVDYILGLVADLLGVHVLEEPQLDSTRHGISPPPPWRLDFLIVRVDGNADDDPQCPLL